MAIVFDWYENPNASSEEEEALHPRIFMNGKDTAHPYILATVKM